MTGDEEGYENEKKSKKVDDEDDLKRWRRRMKTVPKMDRG